MAVVAMLAGILLPALSQARARAVGVHCLNNNRQLALAWRLYAEDHDDRLPYNVGGAGTSRGVGPRHALNWADGILDWELTPDNTNAALLTRGGSARTRRATNGCIAVPRIGCSAAASGRPVGVTAFAAIP
jgi:hypothetical protein